MNKAFINNITRKLGFEVHGNGFIQSLKKSSFKDDAFGKQLEILGNNARVIFDVGANIGDISLQYAGLFPHAAVYAFEPFPKTYNILQHRVKEMQTIQIMQKAIGEIASNKQFYVNHNAGTNSLLQSKKMGLNSDSQVANKTFINVDVITIDSFCEQHKIRSIDILKMDIQGGELAALKGAANLLSEKKIRMIYTETYFREQYIDQPLFHEMAAWLQQYGYYIQDLYNPIYGNGSLAWCDVIFLPG